VFRDNEKSLFEVEKKQEDVIWVSDHDIDYKDIDKYY